MRTHIAISEGTCDLLPGQMTMTEAKSNMLLTQSGNELVGHNSAGSVYFPDEKLWWGGGWGVSLTGLNNYALDGYATAISEMLAEGVLLTSCQEDERQR